MDTQESVKRYFQQIPKNGKLAAEDIRDAAATLGDGAAAIADIIIGHAEGYGINPEKELSALLEAQGKAKAVVAEQKRRTDVKTRAEAIRHQANILAETAETAAPDALAEALSAIGKEVAGLVTTAASVNRFPSWADYEAAWQKDSDQDFSPALFGRLAFPEGTVSYIGARTGRGKTTAMVNIGIEALFPQEKDIKPRRVLFVSLEESHKQILRRFSLCLAYRNADGDGRKQLDTITNPYSGKQDPKNAYKNWKRGKDIGIKEYGAGARTFLQAITEADKKIKEAVEAKNLVFFDGIGASLSETIAAVRIRGRGDIVLLDYIQKIPGAGPSYSGNPDLDRIRRGSESLIEAAIGAEAVVIAGAQFNRESAKKPAQTGRETGKAAGDAFTDADFRGCGDLEQDGHNLIGIGRSADKSCHYYSIIKSREGEVSDETHDMDFAGGYSYMSKKEGESTTRPNNSNLKGKIDDGRDGWV
jgi:hypothetical protein